MSKGLILVVGGAGYIGSHVNKLLNKVGYETVVYDNLSRGNKKAVVKGELVVGDIGDQAALKALFKKYKFDAVMHFAALIDVGESMEHPLKYYRQNVGYTINLIEAILASRTIPLIFSSSSAVYGLPQAPSITEEHPLAPINPYGTTKKMIEEIIADCNMAHNLPHVCLRYFNAAGADPEGEIKDFKMEESNLIPIVLKTVQQKNPHAVIFGGDYDTRDGTCVRDYIHVNDLADAHIRAMEHLLKGGKSDTFNLGNGNGYTVREVVDAIKKVTGVTLDVKVGPRRAGDAPSLISNCQKAKKHLGWTPKFPALETMITDACKYMNIEVLNINYAGR